MHNPEDFQNREVQSSPERGGQRALEEFDALRNPLKEISETNPALAQSMVELYSRILEEVIPRVTVVSDEEVRFRRLSPERTKQLADAISGVNLDLPYFG